MPTDRRNKRPMGVPPCAPHIQRAPSIGEPFGCTTPLEHAPREPWGAPMENGGGNWMKPSPVTAQSLEQVRREAWFLLRVPSSGMVDAMCAYWTMRLPAAMKTAKPTRSSHDLGSMPKHRRGRRLFCETTERLSTVNPALLHPKHGDRKPRNPEPSPSMTCREGQEAVPSIAPFRRPGLRAVALATIKDRITVHLCTPKYYSTIP